MPMINAYKPQAEQTEYTLPPAGDYVGICYQVIDIGTQSVPFKGEPSFKNQVVISFELHGTNADGSPILLPDGRPFSLTYKHKGRLPTLSLSGKANLRNMISAWRGKPVTDLETMQPSVVMKALIGLPATLAISHREYVKTDGTKGIGVDMTPPARVHPAIPVPKMVNDPLYFDIGEWSDETFGKITKGWKTMIEKSAEFKERCALISPAPGVKTLNLKPINPSTGLPAQSIKDLGGPLDDPFDDQIPF